LLSLALFSPVKIAESLNNNGNLTNDYIARTRKGETKLHVSTTDEGKKMILSFCNGNCHL